jgi:N-succinyldiaminopimelate aminotransferase
MNPIQIPPRASRLQRLAGFSIDKVAAGVKGDPDVLRLENLDTDLRPPAVAIAATANALETKAANSYLPFCGRDELRHAVANHVNALSGQRYDPFSEVVICAGATEGLLNVLLALLNPHDEVILTDPTYAGMIYRVLLAGGEPKFVPFRISNGAWRLDLDQLRAVAGPKTRLMCLMNPSMPTGATFSKDEWTAISNTCERYGLWLVYNAAMERILYDGHAYVHPASIDGLAGRTITIGSVSKEYRMIGWRIGWVAGPRQVMADIALTGLYNVVTPPGIAQPGAIAALTAQADGLPECIREWRDRRNAILEDLAGLHIVAAAGGWSMLLDVGQFSMASETASERLLRIGKVAATPMKNWGRENSDQFVRLVFSNEPVQRLRGLRSRVLNSFS